MSLPKPTAILFDWDNTLVDTWPIIHRALHDTFVEYAMEPWTLEQVKARVARSMRDAFPEVFGEVWEAAGKTYQANYRRYHLEMLEPLPGAAHTLRELMKSGLPVAVVSNKKKVNLSTEVAHLGWGEFFASIVGSDDAEFDKPHPAPIHLALRQIGKQPGAPIWFVGDSVIDLECAEKSGISAIFYGDKLPEERSGGWHFQGFPVHHHVPDHAALAALFKRYI